MGLHHARYSSCGQLAKMFHYVWLLLLCVQRQINHLLIDFPLGACSTRGGPVTGILVLKILVPWTDILSGKMVPQDPFFSVKMVRPWKFGPGYANWKDSLWYI